MTISAYFSHDLWLFLDRISSTTSDGSLGFQLWSLPPPPLTFLTTSSLPRTNQLLAGSSCCCIVNYYKRFSSARTAMGKVSASPLFIS